MPDLHDPGQAPVGDDLADLSAFPVGTGPDAVGDARRCVTRAVREAPYDELHGEVLDDVALVTAELVGNAVLHGARPVVVRFGIRPDHVRIEVVDASPRTPVRPSPSLSNMTGRGMALVDRLADRWGVSPEDSGKCVWAEVGGGGQADPDAEAALAAWGAEIAELVSAADLHTVTLGDVPTEMLLEAKAHVDNLVRELTLAEGSGALAGTGAPEQFTRLFADVVHGFADARDAVKRQALAAAGRGDLRTHLVLRLPRSAADAGAAYLAALDECDQYARAARLLTLAAPPEHRLFRRWYVGAVIDQLRAVDGKMPHSAPRPFEDVLIGEVRRLTSAQRVSERAARLQRVTAALARARRPEDVADVVVSEGVAALGASGGGLLVPAADGVHLAVPGVVGYAEGLVGLLREEEIAAPLPAAAALRTGEAVWLETPQERDAQFPALRGFETGAIAMCAVPLVVGDRRLGALRFSFSAHKLFDEDERAFVLALAALTAQTLQRTELYEAERQAALGLQRALLPVELAVAPGWSTTAHYSPAGGQVAGGDFYDVFVVGRTLVAVLGDVMGRGVSAAAAMGQLRSTIRAYALDDPEPATVLRKTDAAFTAGLEGQLATVLYAAVDLGRGTVRLCSAGHLPPILRDGAGRTSLLPIEPALPLGVGPADRPVTTLEIEPGGGLLLCTDGLVERPGEDIDEGIGRVLAMAAATSGWRRADLERMVLELQSAEHDDDVTVLALERDA